MKRMVLILSIISLACIAGCVTATDPFAYPNDPVARATGSRWSWEGSGHYDVGVVIIRFDNVVRQDVFDGRMAFDINDNPVQVTSASINAVPLQWIPIKETLYHANIYESQDSAAFGSADSAMFSFVGYDGESWSDRIAIAPDFGPTVTPDTVTISQGLKILYQNPISNDSIRIVITALGNWTTKPTFDSLYFDTSMVDAGMFFIPANRLPQPSGTNGYDVQISRFQFIRQTSPRGKVVGIYSEMDDPILLDAKP